MRASTKNQKGSPSRDLFKFLHKQLLSPQMYAINSDLELVEKYPIPFIVARLDFKVSGDQISFAEAIAYNEYVERGLPIYLIEAWPNFLSAPPEQHRFNISRYLYADHRPDPPKVSVEPVLVGVTWQGLADWEASLRATRRREKMLELLGHHSAV